MGDERARRVNDALSDLVEKLLPSSPNDSVIVLEKRRQEAHDFARSIIERSFPPNASDFLMLTGHTVMGALRWCRTSIMPPI